MYTNTFGQNYNKFNNSDKLEYPSDNSSYINGIYFFKINNVVTKKMIIN